MPFNPKELIYYDYAPLPDGKLQSKPLISCSLLMSYTAEAAKTVGARRVEDLKDFVSQCDVVTVNCPLHDGTRNLINAELLSHFKKVKRNSRLSISSFRSFFVP